MVIPSTTTDGSGCAPDCERCFCASRLICVDCYEQLCYQPAEKTRVCESAEQSAGGCKNKGHYNINGKHFCISCYAKGRTS
jgi:hypothetical protein